LIEANDLPLTRDAQAMVDRAGEISLARGASEPTSTHLLQAMVELQPSLFAGAKPGPAGNGEAAVPLRRVLVNANREAQSLGHGQLTPLHLLLAMLYSDTPATAQPLQNAGLTLYNVRQRLQSNAPRPSARGVLGVSPVFLGIAGAAAGSGALLWLGSLPRLVVPLTLVFVVAGWIISLCIHEFGHALVAYLGGDRSVAYAGYLTLNPLRYTNATMSLVLPVVFLLLGGIALPGGAVYVNHSALRGKGWSSAVSLAGPGGTLLCWLAIAGAFGISIRAGLITNHNADLFAALAALGFYMTFALLLNLVPVPGLDGFGVIRPWLPITWQYTAYRYGTIAILGVYAVLWFVAPVRSAFYELIFRLTAQASIPVDLIIAGLLNTRLY
jgi:Zn-dependent protease